jgi:hypothetical protein
MTDLGLLMQLAAWKNPGITEKEFQDLIDKFIQCNCGLIMTYKRFLGEHICAVKGRQENSRVAIRFIKEEAVGEGAENSGKTEGEQADSEVFSTEETEANETETESDGYL